LRVEAQCDRRGKHEEAAEAWDEESRFLFTSTMIGVASDMPSKALACNYLNTIDLWKTKSIA
jgi:hypothetical protein